jgi:hypothetical protein
MSLFQTRISEKNKQAKDCYQLAQMEYEVTGRFIWDNDQFNHIKAGDWFMPITGPTGTENCEFYQAEAVLTLAERPGWWSINNIRLPVVFVKAPNLPASWPWKDIKSHLKLAPGKPAWMPTGTQRVTNANRMPFANPFTPDVAKPKKPAKEAKKPAKNSLELIKKMY